MTIFAILLLVERWLRTIAPVPALSADGVAAAPVLPPSGIVLGVGMVLWGIERFLDEHLWLGEDGHLGSLLVQWAGIALAVAGVILLVSRIGPLQRWRRGEGAEGGDQSSAQGEGRGEDEDGDGGDPGSDDTGSDPFAADDVPTSADAPGAADPPRVASTATGAARAERD